VPRDSRQLRTFQARSGLTPGHTNQRRAPTYASRSALAVDTWPSPLPACGAAALTRHWSNPLCGRFGGYATRYGTRVRASRRRQHVSSDGTQREGKQAQQATRSNFVYYTKSFTPIRVYTRIVFRVTHDFISCNTRIKCVVLLGRQRTLKAPSQVACMGRAIAGTLTAPCTTGV
jgi:hypothetical protein